MHEWTAHTIDEVDVALFLVQTHGFGDLRFHIGNQVLTRRGERPKLHELREFVYHCAVLILGAGMTRPS